MNGEEVAIVVLAIIGVIVATINLVMVVVIRDRFRSAGGNGSRGLQADANVEIGIVWILVQGCHLLMAVGLLSFADATRGYLIPGVLPVTDGLLAATAISMLWQIRALLVRQSMFRLDRDGH